MKRDYELIRKILFWYESDVPGSPDEYATQFPGYTTEQIEHHVYLLIQAGFILPASSSLIDEGIAIKYGNHTCIGDKYPQSIGWCLTWAGHDFLDAMRDDTIWNKAKKQLLKHAGETAFGVSFSVLAGWMKWKLAENLGMPPNLTSN